MFVYGVIRESVRVFLRIFGRMEVSGRENVPVNGPVIIVSNHLSYNDPPVLSIALPRRPDFLGKMELFQNPISRGVMKWGRVHPVDRSAVRPGQLRVLLHILREDRCLVIFAEGTRSGGGMLAAKPGAALLALRSGVSILPVAIHGTEKWPLWRLLFPLCRFGVQFGKPFVLKKNAGESLQDVQNRIMGRIAALLPIEYQGEYRAHTDKSS